MSAEMIKPYGDSLNDGIVQLSFTLPVEYGEKAKKAAELYVAKLNFESINVAHARKISNGFTYFVVYARAIPELDFSTVKASEIEVREMGFHEINEIIKKRLKRPIRVIGASLESDAHTVGIDAIMNMKGCSGDYGLERYPQMETFNMGSQVSCELLIQKAVDVKADAILLSQTITKNDIHIIHLREFMDMVEKKNLRDAFLMIVGGSGISNDLALSFGYDAGFGPSTLPSQVASFIVERIVDGDKV